MSKIQGSPLTLAKSLVKSALQFAGLEIRRVDYPPRDVDASVKVALSNRFGNYHLGCGGILANDFLNIDGNLQQFAGKPGMAVEAPGSGGCHVLEHDLRNGIPAAPSSLRVIYHSHFLEHLTNSDAVPFLADCFQRLAGGGVMRFAVPDLELWCKKYVEGDMAFFRWYQESYLGEWWDSSHTKGMTFSGMLYNWGHRIAYDYESLHWRLSKAGFSDIRRMHWGESDLVPGLAILESPGSERRMESLVIECRKPA